MGHDAVLQILSDASEIKVIQGRLGYISHPMYGVEHPHSGGLNRTVLLFLVHVGPHYVARLHALEKVFPKVQAVQLFGALSNHPWETGGDVRGFPCRTLFHQPMEEVNPREQASRALDVLNEVKPELVGIVGYFHPVMRRIAAWAKTDGARCLMIADTTRNDRSRVRLKEAAKRWWMKRHIGSMFVSGERSSAYFSGLGFPEEWIWRGADVVDNSCFESKVADIRKNIEEFRQTQNLPERFFLTVCRLSPEKNLFALLDAFSTYRNRRGKWDLVLVGSGPDEQKLREFQKDRQIPGVYFLGWKSYGELPGMYACASAFILSSISETWGLVVNEAMSCGLPVLVSRRCGCMPELCRRGINGYDFDPSNTDEIAECMQKMSSGDVDLTSMGRASRTIIAQYTPETWAASLTDCIRTTLEQQK